MYVDLDAYAASKKAIVNWLSTRNQKDLISNLSMVAAITHCPCIVAAYFAGEAFGWNEDLIKYVKMLTAFYGYTEILNKPKDSPV